MQKIVKLNQAFLYCCMVVMFCLHSPGYAAPTQGKPVSLNIKNSTLAEILRQVSKKSGLYIYFQDADLAAHKNVTIDVRNKPVENVLHDLLDGRGLSWVEVSENTIAVKKKLEAEDRRIEGDTVATITVTGKVVDDKGEPVIGATVLVKGSKIGTTTSSSGDFVLNDIKSNAWIVISNVSSVSEEVPVRGRATIGKIQLKERVGELDEIVVIPYGSTTRRLNTGNVVSIKAEEIAMQPVNNPLYALQGRVAGLQVTPTTGLAGGAVNIQIRGQNSLNFKTEPLVVIDGLPIVNNITGLGHFNLDQISSLSFINPSDIESIDVLKDADATSIYGSRGANGAILITTKKGKSGQTNVDFNVQTGIANVPNKMKMLSTKEYLEIRKEAYRNSDIDISTIAPSVTSADVKIWDQTAYTDWQKVLIGGRARYNDFQTTVTGGSEFISYVIGGNYHKETTVFPGDNSDQKASLRLSLSGKSQNQKFGTSISAAYLYDDNTLPGLDYTGDALTLAPNAPKVFNPDGTLNFAPLPNGKKSWTNPYSQLYKSYEGKFYNLISSGLISYKILPNLTIKSQLGFNQVNGSSFRKTNPFAGRSPDAGSLLADAGFNSSKVQNISLEPQLNYQGRLSKATFDVLMGGSYQKTNREEQFIYAQGAPNDALLKNLESATYYYLTNASSEYKYAAIFGRLNINWADRYIINLTGRRDGSSRFGPGNQFGNFGSVGVAWIFTNENLLKRHSEILSFGKIRFSYGTSGNDGIGDYQYLERYESVPVSDLYQGIRGYQSTGLFNSYYAWEVTRKMEVGIETGFLKDKLLLSTSYYRNRSNNQLQIYPYPSMAGPGSPLYNIPALIQNSGFEATMYSVNINRSKFRWTTSANFSLNRNKLVSYPDIESSIYYQSIVGRPFYGEAKAYKSAGVDPITGLYQFETNDGKIVTDPSDQTSDDNGLYLRILTLPKFYGGISNSIAYGNLSLDFLIQFTRQTGSSHLRNFLSQAGENRNLPVEFYNRWQKPGDKSDIQKLYRTKPDEYSNAIGRVLTSDFAYTDASFLRLKNISLSYSLPKACLNKLHIKALKVYVQSQNLLTITPYKGLDPETQSTGNLPPLRVITLGLQATL